MLNTSPILQEIADKYSEYFEMEGDNSPILMCKILASLLEKEKFKSSYFEKRLNEMYHNSKVNL